MDPNVPCHTGPHPIPFGLACCTAHTHAWVLPTLPYLLSFSGTLTVYLFLARWTPLHLPVPYPLCGVPTFPLPLLPSRLPLFPFVLTQPLCLLVPPSSLQRLHLGPAPRSLRLCTDCRVSLPPVNFGPHPLCLPLSLAVKLHLVVSTIYCVLLCGTWPRL